MKIDCLQSLSLGHNTLSLIKYPKKLTSFSSRASPFMDYPRNMFYVVHDLQMKRNMVVFTLLFAILIKSQTFQSVSISFLAGINACLKNIALNKVRFVYLSVYMFQQTWEYEHRNSLIYQYTETKNFIMDWSFTLLDISSLLTKDIFKI